MSVAEFALLVLLATLGLMAAAFVAGCLAAISVSAYRWWQSPDRRLP